MKKRIFKRGMAGLLAVLTAFTTLIGMGTTAFAASETAESYMISYPRDGDAVQVYDHSTWGHDAKTYMNGWSTQGSDYTTLHCMDSYDGKVCYCIEPGVPRNVGDTYSGFGENFWDNYPSQYNNTIEPDDIKVLLGRIMQYGHHMKNGTMFSDLCNYTDADFCKEHPSINFDTLSGFGEYQVVAVFKFDTNHEDFRYNEYTQMNEEQFKEFMYQVHARQCYDTGIDAEYGDQLITLSTCEYTYNNGRFVVVAKKV